MARTKTSTRDDTKTLTTSWRNRHLENIYFCVFGLNCMSYTVFKYRYIHLVFLFSINRKLQLLFETFSNECHWPYQEVTQHCIWLNIKYKNKNNSNYYYTKDKQKSSYHQVYTIRVPLLQPKPPPRWHVQDHQHVNVDVWKCSLETRST